MKTLTGSMFLGSIIGAFLIICEFCPAQTTDSPSGHCGERLNSSPSSTKDVLDLKDQADVALEDAYTKLAAQVDTISFDAEKVKQWISSLPAEDLPDLPLVDEGETISEIADLVAALIKKAEVKLKESTVTALSATKNELKESFNEMIDELLPQGIFAADATWLDRCCSTTGYWSSPRVTPSGETEIRGAAGFSVEFDIGGSVGVEGTTEASVSFNVSLSLGLTGWSDARFWPPPTGDDDSSNHTGCSVTVKAQPNWKASYDAEFEAGVLLKIALGKGKDLENKPKLAEVDAVLSVN